MSAATFEVGGHGVVPERCPVVGVDGVGGKWDGLAGGGAAGVGVVVGGQAGRVRSDRAPVGGQQGGAVGGGTVVAAGGAVVFGPGPGRLGGGSRFFLGDEVEGVGQPPIVPVDDGAGAGGGSGVGGVVGGVQGGQAPNDGWVQCPAVGQGAAADVVPRAEDLGDPVGEASPFPFGLVGGQSFPPDRTEWRGIRVRAGVPCGPGCLGAGGVEAVQTRDDLGEQVRSLTDSAGQLGDPVVVLADPGIEPSQDGIAGLVSGTGLSHDPPRYLCWGRGSSSGRGCRSGPRSRPG